MTTKLAAIDKTEKWLRRMRTNYEAGARTVRDKTRFEKDLASCPWELFVHHADYSYFVARTLLSQGVHLYGLFCAHQCVEAYLKALLCHANITIPQKHNLQLLLARARKRPPSENGFLQSDLAETVCLRYEPFYELARYPVRVHRQTEEAWFWFSGEDEQILDYFVHRMRELLVLPPGHWDILSNQGHFHLQLVHEMCPQLHALFVKGNLNFHK
jgi:HEPN domain-containing protein